MRQKKGQNMANEIPKQKVVDIPIGYDEQPPASECEEEEYTFDAVAEKFMEIYSLKFYRSYYGIENFYIWPFPDIKGKAELNSTLGFGFPKDISGYVQIDKRKLGSAVHKYHKVTKNKSDKAATDPFINSVIKYFEKDALVEDDEIDWNLIYVQNGTLSVKDHTVFPSDKETFIPKRIPWPYDEKATCPTIDKAFDDLTRVKGTTKKDNEENILTLFEVPAYALEHEHYLKKDNLFVGEKNHGKTTLLNLDRDFLGDSNVSSIDLYQFNDQFFMPTLTDMLANIDDDIGYGKLTIRAMGLFNSITGGGKGKTVRGMRSKPMKMVPRTKFMFGANVIPSINTRHDVAPPFIDRWVVNFMPNTFPKNKKFYPKLLSEMPGFLNRVLEALERIQKQEAFTKTLAGQDYETLLQIFEGNAEVDSRRVSNPKVLDMDL